MKMRTLLIAVLALVLVCSTVRAADYYVSPTGNDAGTGTIADPWRSPSRGAGSQTEPGEAIGSTVIRTTDVVGFLPSGTVRVGALDYAYSSRDGMNLYIDTTIHATGLTAAVPVRTVAYDATIGGGGGFATGDNIILRGGTYTTSGATSNTSGTGVNNNFDGTWIRMASSGGNSVNPITYKNYPGETPTISITNAKLENNVGGVRNPKGAAYVASGSLSSPGKVQYITLDGINFRNDQNIGYYGNAVDLSLGDTIKLLNSDVISSGSASGARNGVYGYRSIAMQIQNCSIFSRNEQALRVDHSQANFDVSYTALGGWKYGPTSVGGTINMDHVTVYAVEAGQNMLFMAGNFEGSGVTTNSIIVGDSGCTGGQNSDAGSDYNNFYGFDVGDDYKPNWNGGTGLAGLNDISADPNFLVTGFTKDEPNRFDPNWLRYDWSESSATASDTGSWIGAFEPVPEPATLALLLISGLGAALLRRK